MTHVLLLHAPNDAARADEVTSLLEALGYSVRSEPCGPLSPRERRRLTDAAKASRQVLLLWSRAATPSLRVAAAAASEANKLVCARLDAALPPPRLGVDAVGLPRGRALKQALTELVGPPAKAKVAPKKVVKPTRKGSALALTLGLVALCAAGAAAAYALDPGIAAQIKALVGVH